METVREKGSGGTGYGITRQRGCPKRKSFWSGCREFRRAWKKVPLFGALILRRRSVPSSSQLPDVLQILQVQRESDRLRQVALMIVTGLIVEVSSHLDFFSVISSNP